MKKKNSRECLNNGEFVGGGGSSNTRLHQHKQFKEKGINFRINMKN